MKGSKGDTGKRVWVGGWAGLLGVRDGEGGGPAPWGLTRGRQRVSCALAPKSPGLFFLCSGLKCHGQTSNIKGESRASWPHCLLGLPSSCGHSFHSLLLTYSGASRDRALGSRKGY